MESPSLIVNLPPPHDDYYGELHDSPRSEHNRPPSLRSQRPSKERRSSTYGGLTSRDLARMLVEEERETTNLRETLAMMKNQLREETRRAEDADRRARDVAVRLKTTIETKLVVEQEANRIREELRLYRIQFDNAQQQIKKAQEVVRDIDSQRIDAEEAAARARDTARKLKEQRLVDIAREEGRRMGIEEGLARGQDIGYRQGREAGYADGRFLPAGATMEELVDEDEVMYGNEGHSTSSGPSRPPTPAKSPSPPSIHSRSTHKSKAPTYTDPPDRNVPVPPPITTPARIATPQSAYVPSIRVQSPPIVRPVQVTKQMPTPVLHPQVSYPPDGLIPRFEEGSIKLPAPHELSPQPSPPGAPPPLPRVQEVEEPILMVRPPSERQVSDRETGAYSPPRRPRHVRRRSEDSQDSSTISQMEIVSSPSSKPAQARERALSAIPEERSSASPSPNFSHHPSLNHSQGNSPHLTYRSAESLRPELPIQQNLRKSSSLSSEEYNIDIVPPSRPTSNSYTPENTGGILSGDMLSAEYVHRPVQRVAEEPPAPQTPVVSQLPPGFVPTTGPAGVPLPPSTVGSTTRSQLAGMTPGYSFHNGGNIEEPDTAPVIPIIPSRSRKTHSVKPGSTSNREKNRKPPSTDSDEDLSSNLSSDSLATRGKTPLALYAQTPSSIGVPLPPSTVASSGKTATRVPLPPSTVGGTPKSTRSRTTSLRGAYNNTGRNSTSHNRAFSGESFR